MELLTKLGLSVAESRLYETLLEFGSLSVSRLATETGLYRPQVYKHLPRLVEKGLVSESRLGKRKIYFAESPRRLEKLAEDLKQETAQMLPELLNIYGTSETKPVVHYFEGERGIRHVYEDLVASCKKGDIIYRYESPKNYRAVRKYLPNEYRDRFRDRGEVERYIITNEATKEQKRQRLFRYIKVVPAKYDLFTYGITELIYNNKVAFIDFGSKTATLIESPVFAEFQRKIFKLLFEKL